MFFVVLVFLFCCPLFLRQNSHCRQVGLRLTAIPLQQPLKCQDQAFLIKLHCCKCSLRLFRLSDSIMFGGNFLKFNGFFPATRPWAVPMEDEEHPFHQSGLSLSLTLHIRLCKSSFLTLILQHKPNRRGYDFSVSPLKNLHEGQAPPTSCSRGGGQQLPLASGCEVKLRSKQY